MAQQSQICISAPELLVPENEPYQFDRLNRRPSCELLTRFVNCVDGPCTIAIDAAWGCGKTSFLQLWAAHLKKKDFYVIEVNAWETDYFNDPFLAIVGELTKQLEAKDHCNDSKRIGLSELKKGFAKIAFIVPSVAVSRIGLNSEDIADVVSAFKTDASRRLEQYQEQSKSVEEFRSELKSVAQKVRNKTKNPLIVLIDELDRCRPTYAVEFLEVVKHLMGVDHVVYAFAMNRSELAHAVSGCYGPEFNGEGYLRRFFDVDFKLPQPSRRSFIVSLLGELQLESLISNHDAWKGTERLLLAFLDVETISLRQIQQALYRLRLALVLARRETAKFANYALELCTALILRVYDLDMLDKFLNGELSDRDVVEISLPSTVKDDTSLFEERLLFEMITIRAAQEIMGPDPFTRKYNSTPLLQSYKKLVELTSADSNVNSETQFAREIVDRVHRLSRMSHEFKFAVRQLEMLEPLTNSRT